MFKREESRHDFAFIAGVVIGAIAGAAATLAMAPRAGSETRERLRSRVEEFQIDDFRNRAAESIRGAASTGTERVRGLASTAAESPLVETTKARVTEIVERAPVPVRTSRPDEAAGESAVDESTSDFDAEVEPGDAERVFGAVDEDAEEQATSEGDDQPERQSSTQS